MATKENVTANEPGIIGQMYEDRKSKKVGVLESRESKYKTLMLRDVDGKSFNITYSTFKSNWRKYQGEEQIQTSTQVEEKKAESEKQKEEDKKIIEHKTEVVRVSTEDKVKMLRAVENLISDKIKANNLDLKITRTSKGGIVIRHRKYTLFEVWIKYAMDKYDMFLRDVVADAFEKEVSAIKTMAGTEYSVHETWSLKHGYRVDTANFESVLDAIISVAGEYASKLNEQKESKTENKKKGEEEEN